MTTTPREEEFPRTPQGKANRKELFRQILRREMRDDGTYDSQRVLVLAQARMDRYPAEEQIPLNAHHAHVAATDVRAEKGISSPYTGRPKAPKPAGNGRKSEPLPAPTEPDAEPGVVKFYRFTAQVDLEPESYTRLRTIRDHLARKGDPTTLGDALAWCLKHAWRDFEFMTRKKETK